MVHCVPASSITKLDLESLICFCNISIMGVAVIDNSYLLTRCLDSVLWLSSQPATVVKKKKCGRWLL